MIVVLVYLRPFAVFLRLRSVCSPLAVVFAVRRSVLVYPRPSSTLVSRTRAPSLTDPDGIGILALVARFQKANRARRNVRTLFKFRLSGFRARLLAYSVFLERARVAERPLAFRHMHTTLGA